MDKGFFNYSLVLIIIFSMILSVDVPRAYKQHEHELELLKLRSDNKAYNFLMNSGKKRFKNGAYKSAYSEFKLAYDIKPNDEEVKALIHEILVLLCQSDERYCKKLDDLKL